MATTCTLETARQQGGERHRPLSRPEPFNPGSPLWATAVLWHGGLPGLPAPAVRSQVAGPAAAPRRGQGGWVCSGAARPSPETLPVLRAACGARGALGHGIEVAKLPASWRGDGNGVLLPAGGPAFDRSVGEGRFGGFGRLARFGQLGPAGGSVSAGGVGRSPGPLWGRARRSRARRFRGVRWGRRGQDC